MATSPTPKLTPADESATYPVVPLGFSVDVQPGPDGTDWARVQISSIGISATFVFPSEYGESVIDNLTAGIRAACEKIRRPGLVLGKPIDPTA